MSLVLACQYCVLLPCYTLCILSGNCCVMMMCVMLLVGWMMCVVGCPCDVQSLVGCDDVCKLSVSFSSPVVYIFVEKNVPPGSIS